MIMPAATEQFGETIAPMHERRSAMLTAAGVVMFALLGIPFAGLHAGALDSLLPTVDGAALVAMLVSAAILRNAYRSTRFVPHAFLSVAFAATALMLVPYTIAFPGAFSATGFGLGPRVAPWLWVAWHATFVLSIGAYVWSQSYFNRKAIVERDAIRHVRVYAASVAGTAVVGVGLILRFGNALPALITKSGYSSFFHSLVLELLLATCACVFLTLVARTQLRRTNDLWLGVVLVAFAVDLLVGGELVRAPLTVAWYLSVATTLAWQVVFAIAQLRAASERLAAFAFDKETLIEVAQRDALTGIYNRRGFELRFAEALRSARDAKTPLALLALDLDHFKAYNDHFGHLIGDDALRAVASALSENANRTTDSAYRIGGDEFAIVLTSTDAAGAIAVAERIRAAVLRLRIAHAPSARVETLTISIGFVAIDGTGPFSTHEVHERADRALYRAKSLGRNRIVPYAEQSSGQVALRAV